jgi:rhomboid family GlyGly-CTERM serine protease
MTNRAPCLTQLFGVLAIGIHAVPELTETLQFGREAFSRGEIWRLVTGHFTHFGADHLRWDVIAFIAFGSLVEIRSRRAWCFCLAISAVVISLGVALFQPQYAFYRGLSGLDSALFAFVTADLLQTGRRDRDLLATGFSAAAIVGFLGKSLYELTTGLTLFVAPSADFETVPLAHLLGAIVGALSVFFLTKTSNTNALSSAPRKQANERISGHAAQ